MESKYEMIKQIKSQINDISVDLVDEYHDTTRYICDAISQVADDHVDIYNYDLKQWLQEDSEAVDCIEEAVGEFGINHQDFDFYRLIQSGQYLQSERQLYSDIENIVILSALYHLPDDASEEVINTVCDNINSRIDNGNRFNDIEEAVQDIMSDFEEEA